MPRSRLLVQQRQGEVKRQVHALVLDGDLGPMTGRGETSRLRVDDDWSREVYGSSRGQTCAMTGGRVCWRCAGSSASQPSLVVSESSRRRRRWR